jgi:hypothetical protein
METQGYNAPEPPRRPGGSASGRPDIGFARNENDLNGDGVLLSDNNVNVNVPEKSIRRKRPEMKGPKDISSILGETKSIEVVENIKSSTGSNKPSRTKRQGRGTPKNTMSLDL